MFHVKRVITFVCVTSHTQYRAVKTFQRSVSNRESSTVNAHPLVAIREIPTFGRGVTPKIHDQGLVIGKQWFKEVGLKTIGYWPMRGHQQKGPTAVTSAHPSASRMPMSRQRGDVSELSTSFHVKHSHTGSA